MAIVANTFLTYSAIGMREDLADFIDNVSPTETVFMTACRKAKASARKFEWQTDALASAANNAQLEGDDVTFTAVTPTTRWDNYCQISYKTFVISETEDMVNKAGRDSEIDYQTLKQTKEIKRDMNFALIRNTTYNAGNSTTARQTRGLKGWIGQGSFGAGGAFAVPSTNTAPVDGTDRAFDESIFKDMVQDAYTAGGSNWTLYVRPADKVLASAFTGNATRFQDVQQNNGKLRAAYDIYISDFGAIKIVSERQCDNSAYLIDHDHVSVATLRSLTREPLAKTGDASKMLLVNEYGLRMDNREAHAIALDLS